MAVSFQGKTEKVKCGGEVKYIINKDTNSTNLKFSKTVAIVLCESCPFFILCPTVVDLKPPKTQPRLLAVKAFTGMPIGDLLIINEAKLFVEVQTKGGQVLRFDRQTGVQTNCANHKYASRVAVDQIPAYHPPAKAKTPPSEAQGQ